MFLYLQHCAGVNCLALLKSSGTDGSDYLFTGSRDGTLKRWALTDDAATCSTTFESHVDWVLFIFFLPFSLIIFTCQLLEETIATLLFFLASLLARKHRYGTQNEVPVLPSY